MKHNLKNAFPHHPSDCVCSPCKWKRCFEKELRAKLKFQSKYHYADTYGMRIMKEILGDA